jgi:ferric-dicitrate binding protein FerR (iron transport regulator)
MTDNELEVLLAKFAADSLIPQEHAVLVTELERNEEARLHLAEIAEVAFAVGEAGRTRAVREVSHHVEASPTVRRQTWWRPALAWAALVILLASAAWFYHATSPQPLLEVVEARGAVSWSSAGTRLPFTAGMRLPPGVFESESETGTAEVRFMDGTRFTLQGNAEAVFDDNQGKRVWLKRGTFSADVTKQRPGRPLRVRTATAEVEVLGTLFAMEAAPQRTSVSVAAGRVRLRRLVDGREVEVAPKHYVAASLFAAEELVPRPVRPPSGFWTLDLRSAPEHFTGQWQPADGVQPALIAAAPIVERRESDGAPYVHYGIIVRAASHPADSFVALTDNSLLRLKLRIRREFPLQIIVSTRRPDGSFAGNFELTKPQPTLIPGSEWQRLELALHDFTPLHPSRSTSSAGSRACAIIITTLHESVGLEVTEVSIGSQPNEPAP